MLPSIAVTTLSFIAEKVFDSFAGNVSDELYQKLKGDPIKKAFQRALGTAIQRYAAGDRLVLAKPLIDRKGFLSNKEVSTEIAKMMRFNQKPDIYLIANQWAKALPNLTEIHDFSLETQRLLDLLESELRSSETFRPVFEARDIYMIKTVSEDLDSNISQIGVQLDGIGNMLDSRLSQLLTAFSGSITGIHDQILDSSLFIEEKTRDFVGRQWIFDQVDRFLKDNPRGYFFIRGDPGIGKSALAAQLVKKQGYIHHFNIRAIGVNRAASFLKNVCAQLIAVYKLSEYENLPPEATENAGFLIKILIRVAKKLEADERCVIVVDGLDEVDRGNTPVGENLLFLPESVPDGVFFIITMRDVEEIKPRIDCEQSELIIDHASPDNRADIKDYIKSWIPRPGIQKYNLSAKLSSQEFVDILAYKSEGNFIYLHYILPEIARGAYNHMKLDTIPRGLKNYYQDHWFQMRGQNQEEWFNYKLPVILALTVAPEPISIDLIAFFSKINDKRRIGGVIKDWYQFLHIEEVEVMGQYVPCYHLYHASFFEFIASKQEIKDEHVNLKAAEAQILDLLWNSPNRY